MPIIITIAIIIFIFKGGFLKVLELLFHAIVVVFEFFATVFGNISTRRYQSQDEKARKNRLYNIDKAYKEKDYKKVISLYREVIRDHDYLNFETMKYCHIASDAVCQIAETIPEYEEARTWTRIISFRDSYYQEEADKLYLEITIKGYKPLKVQQELFEKANKHLESDEFDKVTQLLNQAADNGNIDALMTLAEIYVKTINSLETMDAAKDLLDRMDAIEINLSSKLRQDFDNNPFVKYMGYLQKSAEYDDVAKNQEGMDFVNTMLKSIGELEKSYDALQVPYVAMYISRYYIRIVLEYLDAFPGSRYIFEKCLEYLNLSQKWLEAQGDKKEDGSEQVEKDIAKFRDILEEKLNK